MICTNGSVQFRPSLENKLQRVVYLTKWHPGFDRFEEKHGLAQLFHKKLTAEVVNRMDGLSYEVVTNRNAKAVL